MKLENILQGVSYILLSGKLDIQINDIRYDSRNVTKGDVFVALKGYDTDGHDYIPEAISRGASVIVVSKMVNIHGDVTVIKVDNTRIALSYMAANFFDNPASKLTIIGVTGTTGKTTTTFMIREILEEAGIRCGIIGSIGIKYLDKDIHTDNTTPESYEIHKAFANMAKEGITHVVMEASSQGFKLNRLAGITFDIGVLTNVTIDHIGPGEHDSHEEYVMCKNRLFLNSKKVISNNDSNYLESVLKGVEVPIITYAINNSADLKVEDIHLINDEDFLGSEFKVQGLINDTFKISIPGEFNIYNAMCAILVSYCLDVDMNKVKDSLLKVRVRGRMETVLVTPKFKVLIDYAHTEDGMKELVKTLKEYHPKRLVSVFGGGGNRAKERRYSLGEIIGGASDLCILTMDNPRFEEISSINMDIKVGLDRVNAKYVEIPDRVDAIKYAVHNAQDGDLILLVGKGHEEYQDIKGTKYHFSEIEVINSIKNDLK